MNPEDLPEEPGPEAAEDEVEAFLEAVLFHYILRCEEGSPPDPDLYLARYPRHAPALAAMMAGGVDAPIVQDRPGTATRERRRGWGVKTLGGCDIEFLAASTGSSHVYRARPRGGGPPVALKVQRRAEQVDNREVARFRREGEILKELSLEGVVPFMDVGEEDGSLYVVMPWVEGVTLLEVIDMLAGKRQPGSINPLPLSLRDRVRLIASVARCLEKVHSHGILHRDIKPSNIMVDRQRRPVLIDFGIARKEGTSALTRSRDLAQGTPRYMAPEVLCGEALSTTVQGEVYALGLTLYELLLERPAIDATSRGELFDQVRQGPPRSAHLVDRRIPRALSRIVDRAITHDLQQRFKDMAAFAASLEDYLMQKKKPAGRVLAFFKNLLALLILAALFFWILLY